MRRTSVSMYHEYRRGPDGKRRKFYCVQWPKVGRGRHRQYFKDHQEARRLRDQKLEERSKYGVAHLAFSDKQRIEYAECIGMLKPFSRSLVDAVKHFAEYLKATEKSRTVAELVEEVIAAKARACGKRELPASKRYMDDLNSRLGRFKKDFGERILATITKNEIGDWLDGLKDERTGQNRAKIQPAMDGNCIGSGYASRHLGSSSLLGRVDRVSISTRHSTHTH